MIDQIIENQPISMQALAAQTGPTPIAAMATSVAVNGQLALETARAKAEIDQQITTAKSYPRNVSEVANRIHSLVMLDEQTAGECVYALPRGGKAIRGPSIRFAEIMASQWGNCRQGSRTVQIDKIDKMVVVEAVFHDLETNSATTKRVSRRISGSNGKLYNDDMITMTANAAQSIALRNAILGGIPKAVWRGAFFAAEQVIAGDVKTLVERRDATITAFAAWGIVPEQITAYLEVGSVDEISIDDIVTMRGVYTSIKDDGRNIEDVFEPVKKPKTTKPKKTIEKQLEAKSDGEKNDDPSNTNSTNEDKPIGRASGDQSSNVEAEVGESSQSSTSAPDDEQQQESQDQPFTVARNRGREAAENGLSPRAIPPEYRGDDDNSVKSKTAWEEGFAARTDELKQEQG